MTEDLKQALTQLFSRLPRPFYTGAKTKSECKRDCANWHAEMINIKNLEAFERFIEQPTNFVVEHSISGDKDLQDTPDVNRKFIENQIRNQTQLKSDLQEKIRKCNRKVRF